MNKKISLKDVISRNKVSEFINQNQDKSGNKYQFDSTLDSMLKKKKSAHQTSQKDSSEN